jgi:C2 domain
MLMFTPFTASRTASLLFSYAWQFVNLWPDMRSVFVPRRYSGVISGVLQKAEGLPVPIWGLSDPYVVLRVGQLKTVSKKNTETSKRGKGPGDAVWNEGWELEVQNPETALLTVEVREGNAFCYYGHNLPAIAPILEESLQSSEKAGSVASAIADKEQRHILASGILLGSATLEIKSLIGGTSKKIRVGPLAASGGTVLLDLCFSQYVDPRPM